MRVTGMLQLVMAASMLLPVAASLYYKDGAQFDLALSALAMGAAGLLFRNILGRDPDYAISERESFWTTAIIWLAVPLTGSLPYLFTGVTPRAVDALFESYAGFTTCGATALSFSQHVPEGLLVWRSMTQWFGGLGLVLFVIAVLRRLNVGGAQLYEAEFSGTVQRKLRPHLASTVGIMWRVYIALTVALLALLLVLGNAPLPAFCVALGTVSTGGFLPAPDTLSHFSHTSLLVVACFMFLSGINIALLFYLLTFKPREVWRDEEFHVYLGVFLCAAAICFASFLVSEQSPAPGRTAMEAFFQAASSISTCGFAFPGQHRLPPAACAATFLFILVGASSGSTGGGIKWKRIMVMVKYIRNYVLRMLHPNTVRTVMINRIIITEEYVNKILAFVFLYLFFIAGGAFLLTVCGLSIPDAFLVAVSNISDVGPENMLVRMGADFSYAALPALGKWTLMALMLVGRVEIFAFVALFSPAYWKRG
ncbi:MAG: potassium transporter TrkG [Bacteroidales bacterium]|nr:potassium transporter TrkG [Bacteroidales bacterium]